MGVKTESGVSISIIPRRSSKIVLFDKPVRLIELKEAEITRISALLASNLEQKASLELPRCESHAAKIAKPISR